MSIQHFINTMVFPLAEHYAVNNSPLAAEVARLPPGAIIWHPEASETTLTEKLP